MPPLPPPPPPPPPPQGSHADTAKFSTAAELAEQRLCAGWRLIQVGGVPMTSLIMAVETINLSKPSAKNPLQLTFLPPLDRPTPPADSDGDGQLQLVPVTGERPLAPPDPIAHNRHTGAHGVAAVGPFLRLSAEETGKLDARAAAIAYAYSQPTNAVVLKHESEGKLTALSMLASRDGDKVRDSFAVPPGAHVREEQPRGGSGRRSHKCLLAVSNHRRTRRSSVESRCTTAGRWCSGPGRPR